MCEAQLAVRGRFAVAGSNVGPGVYRRGKKATMRLCRSVLAVVTLFALSGCATPTREATAQAAEPSYSQQVLDRPIPTDEDARIRECNWIRSEIARQQGLAGAGMFAPSPESAFLMRAIAQDRVAALLSRASNVGCTAAFGNSPARQDFDACFSRCQRYTDRTKEQCFDACNK
jgi:hypothetical protein